MSIKQTKKRRPKSLFNHDTYGPYWDTIMLQFCPIISSEGRSSHIAIPVQYHFRPNINPAPTPQIMFLFLTISQSLMIITHTFTAQ